MIMKKENILLLSVIIFSLLLSTIPYGVAYFVQPDDMQFMGIVSDVPDVTQYMAWMKASARNIIIENPLTPEPQAQPTFFNLLWLVLGRFGAWFHLSPAALFQLFRISTSIFFLLLTYKICRSYFRDEPWAAWSAWLLINFSAGLGWLLVLEKQLTGAEDVKHPLAVYVAEPITFQNIMIFPHFLFAAGLLLLIFRLFVISVERKALKYSLLSGLMGLILGVTHAYDLAIVYGVLGVYTLLLILRDGLSRFLLLAFGLVVAISVPPAAYFFVLTTTDPLWREVLAQFSLVNVYTPDPLLLIVLIGIPLILAVLTFDGLFPLSKYSHWQLLIRIWFIVNFFLLYIPTDFQIHMLSGWQIPLAILATEGLFWRLLPSFSNRIELKNFAEKLFPKFHLAGLQWALVIILLLTTLPTNIYLLAWRVREVLRVEHNHYLYKDELAALDWLEKNTNPSEIVFADLPVGQHIPGIAGNKVYLGHWAQTVDFYTKQANVKAFFQKETSEEQRTAILRQFDVSYVFYGRKEKALGDLDPSQLPYLTPVFELPNTHIYRINLDNELDQSARTE